MEKKTIELKASYFKDSIFVSNDCPIGRAVIEQLGFENPGVGYRFAEENYSTWFVFQINKRCIVFDAYELSDFKKDKKKAKLVNFLKTQIIREIPITWQ